jgi:hypothetical protein
MHKDVLFVLFDIGVALAVSPNMHIVIGPKNAITPVISDPLDYYYYEIGLP